MENITTGHWIFAALFAVTFVILIAIQYRKDVKVHSIHYRSVGYIILGIIAIYLLIFFLYRL